MAIKLFGSSITSVYKSVVRTVSKNVSKGSGSSGNKVSATATSKVVTSKCK